MRIRGEKLDFFGGGCFWKLSEFEDSVRLVFCLQHKKEKEVVVVGANQPALMEFGRREAVSY